MNHEVLIIPYSRELGEIWVLSSAILTINGVSQRFNNSRQGFVFNLTDGTYIVTYNTSTTDYTQDFEINVDSEHTVFKLAVG